MDAVDVAGNTEVDEGEILDAMATRENPRFLGLVEGFLYDFSIFNRAVLERDMARVERRYRALGFYQAHVRASRIHRVSDDEVRVEVIVQEGPRVVVEAIHRQNWPEGLELPDVEDGLMAGEPFIGERYETHEAALREHLRANGYAWAEVDASAEVDLAHDRADVTFDVDAGPLATFGETKVEGLVEVPEERLRAHFRHRAGESYSTVDLQRTEQALLNLGVFSAVVVEPERGDRPEASRPVEVVVRVDEGELRQVKLGGGIELTALKSDVHLRAAWEDRNLLGGMRKLSFDLRPGVVLYPLRINNWVAPERPLLHGEVRTRFEQPGFPEARTTTFVAPSFGVEPVLLQTDPAPEDPVLGYVDFGGAVGVERHWFDRKLRLAVQQNVRYDVPFTYLGDIDDRLGDILLSYPEVTATVDLRDDPLRPHAGLFAEVSLQANIFGTGRDVRITPDVRGYIPLGDDVTLALRGQLGLLQPFGYGTTLPAIIGDNAVERTAAEVRDLQLLYFRGYFAGGPGSNRGYAPRSIGPHARTPFINPDSARASCLDGDPTCLTATGGHTLWTAAAALRFPIYDPLLGAVFCDAADVAPAPFTFRARPHLSCGGGLRIDTPVGPIRADLGYRIPGLQVLTESRVGEGNPGTLFGAPMALSIGIGQAF